MVVGNGPDGIAFDGAHLWVANSTDGTVAEVDPITEQVLQTVAVQSDPTAVAFTGHHIWVTNSGSNSVSEIDISSGTDVMDVSVGNDPQGIAFDGSALWVANYQDGKIQSFGAAIPGGGGLTVGVGAGPTGLPSTGLISG
ncbi:MAG TPA: hypothetical protein VFB34_03580 [Chloroflexota bacterium]|nr:hypothetical protein [Chloroflexota bacterium]